MCVCVCARARARACVSSSGEFSRSTSLFLQPLPPLPFSLFTITVDCSSLSCTSCGFAEVPGVPFDYTDVAHSNWGSTAGWVGNNRCFYNTIANQ